MTNPVTQTFIPGPRLIDGSDLNTAFGQVNAAIGPYGTLTSLTTSGAGTVLAADIVSRQTARGGAQTGAFTDTTDTAALIVAALPAGSPVGFSFLWTYQNNTNQQATLAGGSNVTISGNAIVPALTAATYLVTSATATTVTLAFISGAPLIPLPVAQVTTDGTGTGTLAATGLGGAQTTNLLLNSTVAAGAQAIPPASQLVAAIPNAAAGLTYMLNIRNTGLHTVHLNPLTSTHLVGLLTNIPINVTASAQVTVNSLTDVTITGLGKSAG